MSLAGPLLLSQKAAWSADDAEASAAKQEPATTAAVVQAVLAAAATLAGVNATLTTSAEVRAVAKSKGPDDDDLLTRFDQDIANIFTETHLQAATNDTVFESNVLGENGGSVHKGSAWMEMETPLTDTAWSPVHRSAFAWAQPDTTPERNVDNTTAVASIGTFHLAGSEDKDYTVREVDPAKQPFRGVALPEGEDDALVSSTGAVLWSVNNFTLEEDAGMVTVTPPVPELELFHDFVQLSTSPRYRKPYSAGMVGPGPAKDLLETELAAANVARDAAAYTVPLPDSVRPDFTLCGAKLVLPAAVIERGDKTDREIVEEYLTSGGVYVAAPDNAQVGYNPAPTAFVLIGGGDHAPAGTLFEQQGGLDGYLSELALEGGDPEDMVGLLVETEGSLLAAMNLAAPDPSHPLYSILNGKAIGDTVHIQMLFQQTDLLTGTSEAHSTVDCLELGAGLSAMTEVWGQVGGEDFATEMLEASQELETDVPTANSNPLLAMRVPDCDTEIIGQSSGVAVLESGTFAKAVSCGESNIGTVVCANPAAAPPAGQWVAVSMILGSFLPEADPWNHYQYGFVFDSDGNNGNNWVPLPQFANDYFQGTDLWYTLDYSPSAGWQLNVRSSAKQASVVSAARVVIRENTLTLFVPADEFDTATPTFRLTSFRHAGDFGQNPPYNWFADYHPRLDAPRASISGVLDIGKRDAQCGCGTDERSGKDLLGDTLVVVLLTLLLTLNGRALKAERGASRGRFQASGLAVMRFWVSTWTTRGV